jgi:8-oxo-dGTP pyrophosphatase MutT (NUDIX family)
VSAVVEDDGRFLMVEERASGVDVINLPGGHIEAGESPEQAAERETLEEAGCHVGIDDLLGVYLWIHPQTRQNFLRIVYVATLLSQDTGRPLDDGVHAVHWYTRSDVEHHRRALRTPTVLRAIEDYLDGKRQPLGLLDKLMPIQQNVHEVLASASLV